MAKRDKKKEKRKEKKKEKGKKDKKSLKQARPDHGKASKQEKKKASTKALKKEIEQLRAQLKAHVDTVQTASVPEAEASVPDVDELEGAVNTGSVSERKKSWERHQYLRTRYEHHLDSGSVKVKARVAADRDLRARYGDEFGYTAEELDSILS